MASTEHSHLRLAPLDGVDRSHPADFPDLDLLTQIRGGALKAGELSRVTIQLRPPELGTVEIAVESRQGDLRAHFHSTHPLVHNWLEANAPALRSHLAESGLALSNMTLSTSSQHQGAEWSQQPGVQPHRPSPTPPPAPLAPAHRTVTGDRIVDCFA